MQLLCQMVCFFCFQRIEEPRDCIQNRKKQGGRLHRVGSATCIRSSKVKGTESIKAVDIGYMLHVQRMQTADRCQSHKAASKVLLVEDDWMKTPIGQGNVA